MTICSTFLPIFPSKEMTGTQRNMAETVRLAFSRISAHMLSRCRYSIIKEHRRATSFSTYIAICTENSHVFWVDDDDIFSISWHVECYENLLVKVNKFRFPEQDFLNLFFAHTLYRLENKYLCVVDGMNEISIDYALANCAAIDFGTNPCLLRAENRRAWKPWMNAEDILFQRNDSLDCNVSAALGRLKPLLGLWR